MSALLPSLAIPPLAWPALAALLGVLAVAALIAGWLAARRTDRREILVAHTEFLRQLSSYRRLVAGRKGKLSALLALFVLTTLFASVLAGRPVAVRTQNDKLATRDIVLCLDVSGSMLEYDSEIVEKFRSMVDSFRGERIALVMWNSTARTVFPLTDDYPMVSSELDHIATVLNKISDPYTINKADLNDVFDVLVGTAALDGQSASLIGDGLANCVLTFDLQDQERSRSIIFATDNELAGNPVYQLNEAATFAKERGISVLGMFVPGSLSSASRADFERDLQAAGGKVYDTRSPETVDAVIDEITSTQAAELDAQARSVQTDEPQPYAPYLIGALLASLALCGWWRL